MHQTLRSVSDNHVHVGTSQRLVSFVKSLSTRAIHFSNELRRMSMSKWMLSRSSDGRSLAASNLRCISVCARTMFCQSLSASGIAPCWARAA